MKLKLPTYVICTDSHTNFIGIARVDKAVEMDDYYRSEAGEWEMIAGRDDETSHSFIFRKFEQFTDHHKLVRLSLTNF